MKVELKGNKMFHALRSVVLSASSRLASSLTNVVRGRRLRNIVRRSSLRRRLYCSLYIYKKINCRLKNKSDCKCNSVHIINALRSNPSNEILCMTILPLFSQFLWNLKSISSCSHENLFFGVTSYNLLHL